MFNKLLDDRQRALYRNSIEELFKLCPEKMSRKIVEANVQQGFVFDTVKKFTDTGSKILCVGAYEDTAAESLRKLGYTITEIDSMDSIWGGIDSEFIINSDLNTFTENYHSDLLDVVFSTSVIEHVEDDELFLDQICKLLNCGGYGIITCDFNDSYKSGDPKPVVDYRLYTINDLSVRFLEILEKNNCSIFGHFDWSGPPDFDNGQARYSFASYVFRKNP